MNLFNCFIVNELIYNINLHSIFISEDILFHLDYEQIVKNMAGSVRRRRGGGGVSFYNFFFKILPKSDKMFQF